MVSCFYHLQLDADTRSGISYIGDHAAHYENKPNTMPDVQNTLDVIVKMVNMPSCNKIATGKLMNSCQMPDDKNNNFESLSNSYAANLAVCELYDAGLDIPTECLEYLPSVEMLDKLNNQHGVVGTTILTDKSFSYHDFDKTTRSTAAKCVKRLGSTSQTWTSYSNNKQNAFHICKAYRADIDRGMVFRYFLQTYGWLTRLQSRWLTP